MDLDPVLGAKSLGSPKKKRCKKAREKKVIKGKKLSRSGFQSLASEKPNFSAEMVGQTSQAEVKNISTDAKAQKRPRYTNVSSKDSAASTGRGSDSTIALDSVFKIQAPSSLCVSGARETKRRIEEQTELTLQLQQQRLQHLSARGSVELNLREPNEQKIPVPIAPKLEPGAQREDIEFPEITTEMQSEIHGALFGGSQDQTISDGFRLSVTRRDILTLNALNWLNDEVINFYMNMLMERSKRKGFPNVHAFSTFFYPLLKSAGYQSVKRWTKKLDIFTMDILLVPIHLDVHWCLAVIDLRKKSITHYDSMAGLNKDVCRILMQYLHQESLDKKGRELDSNGWQLTSKKSQEIPQQNNGSDCGMFSCKYADYISQDKEITFTQNHMPYFRKRMVWEIIHQKLL